MEIIMNVVQQYYDALLQIGVTNFNSASNGEDKFLSDYLTGLTAPVVFDVGANVGKFTETVMNLNETATVYAFEPHPLTFEKLQENAFGHGFHPCNFGLGDKETGALLYDYVNQDGSEHASVHQGVIEQIHHGEALSHDIRIRTLDVFVCEKGIDRIHLLKVDTEGNEMAVFKGGEKTIRSGAVDVIQFEFNEMNVISRTFFKDFFDFLPEYDFFRLTPQGALFIRRYTPIFCEIFGVQNIVCVKKGLNVFNV
jgi:FkbM family methyltransferase